MYQGSISVFQQIYFSKNEIKSMYLFQNLHRIIELNILKKQKITMKIFSSNYSFLWAFLRWSNGSKLFFTKANLRNIEGRFTHIVLITTSGLTATKQKDGGWELFMSGTLYQRIVLFSSDYVNRLYGKGVHFLSRLRTLFLLFDNTVQRLLYFRVSIDQ